jgi:hypothetical protein
MAKYLLIVDYRPGVEPRPMEEWSREDVKAHIDYYAKLNAELVERGEYVDGLELTPPAFGREVTAGTGAPVVTDGPFAEVKEMLAGFTVVDVESEERAIEIAAALSRVPAPGGVPIEQPITVRRVMGAADFEALTGEV